MHRLSKGLGLLDWLDGSRLVRAGHVRRKHQGRDVHGLCGWHVPGRRGHHGVQAVYGRQLLPAGRRRPAPMSGWDLLERAWARSRVSVH